MEPGKKTKRNTGYKKKTVEETRKCEKKPKKKNTRNESRRHERIAGSGVTYLQVEEIRSGAEEEIFDLCLYLSLSVCV